MMSEFDDKPITSPKEDKFGFKTLAKTIADSISKMTAPEGTVIAINGPWGSGKSSFINLVRHHLDNSTNNDELTIVDFKCWRFRGEEALTIAFFHELNSAMKPNMNKRVQKVIPQLVPQLLLGASPVIESAMGMPGASLYISKTLTFIANLIKRDETVEKLHQELSNALKEGKKRYLVIIDDIDRLSPDETMLIFRLVKSVGGLPNVMYLLAYDRQLAERIVKRRYPSEGPHYLEKIVQASFDLPEPTKLVLKNAYLDRTFPRIIAGNAPVHIERFGLLLDAIIVPEMKTPRDLLKILNPLMVTWSAVKDDVDVADFLGIETLRVKHPGLYYALRSNKDYLTKITPPTSLTKREGKREHPQAQTCEDIFLKPVPEDDRERLRRGLMLLFPALAHIWEYGKHKAPDTYVWEDQRRICSPNHFDTYFRFARLDHQ